MESLAVFSICGFFSLTVCYFTVEAQTPKEKLIVLLWVSVPSLVAAYDVDGPREVWAALRGFIGPWLGVAVWQIYMKHELKKSYRKILAETTEEVNHVSPGTERGRASKTS